MRNYKFLTSGNVQVPGIDDAAEFRLTVEAMTIMGISPEDQSGTYITTLLNTYVVYATYKSFLHLDL